MDELRLEAVGLTDRVGVVADVIFVHGLGGGAQTTWQADGDASIFWPLWIFEDFPEIRVWTLAYPADKFRWSGSGGEMVLPDRAKAIIDLLVANGIGLRPMIFVAHSLGGLLVKQILRIGSEMNHQAWQELVANVRGVLFLATPHQGAGLASLAKALSLLGSSPVTTQLASNDPHLRDLNDWYQQNAGKKGFRTHAYFETRPLGPGLVVDEGSANPGVQGCIPIPFDGNHIEICKPTSRFAPIYVGARKFFRDILGSSTGEVVAGQALRGSIAQGDDSLSNEEAPSSATLDEFEFFTKKIDEDERLDLAEKLRRGGRELEIPRALLLKEQFAKRFARNQLQTAATRHYIRILAEVESRFNAHVFPEIAGGAPKATIADLIRTKVTDPILAAWREDDLLNAVVIDRMIYYLTGLCHVRWSP